MESTRRWQNEATYASHANPEKSFVVIKLGFNSTQKSQF